MKQILRQIYRIKKELSNRYNIIVKAERYYKVPLLKRLFCYLHGLKSDEYVQYNLEKNDYREYITEYERLKTREVNEQYKFVMDNKLIYNEVFGKYIKVPDIYFWIKAGKCFKISASEDFVTDLIQNIKIAVIKPIDAGGGVGVHILTFENDVYYCDGEKTDVSKIDKLIKSYREAIVTEYIYQADFWKSLFDKTTNTMRIVIGKKKHDAEFKVLAAVQRIGRNSSIPVDNLCNGGLCSTIELKTGVLGKAASYVNKDGSDIIRYSYHPDTNEQIEGKKIPNWDNILLKLLDVCNMFPYINFFAWDIVITDDLMCAIEVNASSGLEMFQLENGIRNTEFGEIYKSYNIIK